MKNNLTVSVVVLILLSFIIFNLSSCSSSGKGKEEKTDYEILIGKKDYQGALAIIRPLADKNDPRAMRTLGIMYFNGNFGLKKDYNEGFKWFKKAAEKGDGISQNMVGLFYKDGLAVNRDMKEAFKWIKKASDNGVAGASCELGSMYLEGNGVEQNYSTALDLFVKAAEGGDFLAFNNLGVMYNKGLGVERNFVEGTKYLYIAHLGGEKLAERNLTNILQFMSKEQIDEAGARADALKEEINKCSKTGKPLKLKIEKPGIFSKLSKALKSSEKVSCSDSIITGMVIDRAHRAWATDMAQMGMKRNQLSVQNIRTREQTGNSCKCAADIIVEIKRIGLRRAKPVQYTAEMTDDGRPYVTVHGF